MNVHEVAHPVARTMAIVDLVSPDRRPGNGVEQRRQYPSRERGTRQGNHALEYTGAVLLLCLAGVTDRHHAGDVGSAAQVLTARVDQQQAITLDERMRLLGGTVVWHRAIAIEGGNGRKAQ